MSEKETKELEEQSIRISRLRRTSHALEFLTFVTVILISPVSLIFALPFGIPPEVYLTFWLRYVFIFVVVALLISVAGLTASSSYWIRAERIRKGIAKN